MVHPAEAFRPRCAAPSPWASTVATVGGLYNGELVDRTGLADCAAQAMRLWCAVVAPPPPPECLTTPLAKP